MSWSLRFHEPIVLPDGAKLATLREAVSHLGKAIPKSERNLPSVVTAAEMLTLAAERAAPIEFARIATLKALNRHQVRQFTDRKDPHWGRLRFSTQRSRVVIPQVCTESRNVPMSLRRHYGRTKGTRRDRIKQNPVRKGASRRGKLAAI